MLGQKRDSGEVVQFALHLTSDSERCDYRFSCNEALHIFAAESLAEAREKALDLIEEEYGEITPGYEGHQIHRAVVYQIADESSVDLKGARAAALDVQNKGKAVRREAEERAVLARLERKYR